MDVIGQVGRAGQVGPVGKTSERAALVDTQRAFDGVAEDYDRSNAENRILSAMRERVRQTVERFVPPGSRILDLGCGPGADAEYFARRGDRVVAIDWSPAMVQQAERRMHEARLADRVVVQQLGIHEIDCLEAAAFDAVCSNFGPLNCVPDLAAAMRAVAARLRPNGVVIASVIARVRGSLRSIPCGATGAARRCASRRTSSPCRWRGARCGLAITRRPSSNRSPPLLVCLASLYVPSGCARRRRISRPLPIAIRRWCRRSNSLTTPLAPGRWPGDGAITF
jgi:2-polyprenyl-3-methyl-5-hydroxy-6-metoxy-1,4-benzoquinol methylase